MIRTFQTNSIRKISELSGKLWDFTPLDGKDKTFPVPVPSAWETYPGYEAYRGEGKYSTTFTAEGNVRLLLKGVSHTAKVFVDGTMRGTHYNAYTPFEIFLKGLPGGEHLLEVIADNRFSEESSLHIPNDYMSYGGITRGVVLEQLNCAYIKWIHITPEKKGDTWKAGLTLCISNVSDEDITLDATVTINKTDLKLPDITIKANTESLIQTEAAISDAEEWSMEHPNLYTVEVTLFKDGTAIDDLTERIGFREVKIENSSVFLNGKALLIKGICRHEDHPAFGCAIPFSQIASDLQTIKDMGVNSIRCVHYPNDEIFLDLCDELGILIWEENHARGLSEEHMRNPNFERQAEEVIREMIMNHYNHPSIYIWGILNECASETPYGRECYKKQYELIRQLDSSRPRSSASCKFKTDICLDFPEVVSYNIYPKWYHNTPVREYLDDLYQWVQTETPGKGKPFLITEVGAGAIYGYRSPAKVKWSEEYQADTLGEQLTAILEHPGASGLYIWQFCDVRISDEWFLNRPRTMNNKGIVDEYRRHKLSYEVVKEIYTSYGNFKKS
ncbi:beta-galactosidase/beta-glucuronidase [Clostridium sp. ASBs410]|nr:beta-galactosidase/beta-glucuronidase [Clostridium sp. ASBs410]